MIRLDLGQAGADLEDLAAAAEAGEEVVITRPGKPDVWIVVDRDEVDGPDDRRDVSDST